MFFPFRSGDRFPSITELKVFGYAWDIDTNWVEMAWHWASPWFDQSTPIRGDATAWKGAMDWSRLKRLEIDRPSDDFLIAFKGELKSIESLTIRSKLWDWELEVLLNKFVESGEKREKLTRLRRRYTSFITSLPPLGQLNLNGMANIVNVTAILEIHGPSLRSLALHERQIDCLDSRCGHGMLRRSPAMSVDDFKLLVQLADKVELLELDVAEDLRELGMSDQQLPWMADFLQHLQSLPMLKDLVLHFPAPQNSVPSYECFIYWDEHCESPKLMGPPMDEGIALSIFRRLRAIEDGIGERLEQLTLYADILKRPPHPLSDPYHANYQLYPPTKWSCSVDDDGREGCFDAGWELGRHNADSNDIDQLRGLIEVGE